MVCIYYDVKIHDISIHPYRPIVGLFTHTCQEYLGSREADLCKFDFAKLRYCIVLYYIDWVSFATTISKKIFFGKHDP